VTIVAFAVAAPLGNITWVVAKGEQGIQMRASPQIDRPTVAAIAPRRPTTWHKLFAAKGHTTIATVATSDLDDGFVNKHSAKHEAQG
jgi:methylthioribose-1-phosphate isomerase